LHIDGITLQLRPTEARLLAALLQTPKWVLTYDQLAAALPHGDVDEDPKRTIHAHFSRLGASLRPPLERATGLSCRHGSGGFLWENVRGTGYAINGGWPGWAGLEALGEHATAAPASGIALAPAADDGAQVTEQGILADAESSDRSQLVLAAAAEGRAAGTIALARAADPSTADPPSVQHRPAARPYAFWGSVGAVVRWRARRCLSCR
jgi:hypothetical protein